MDIKNLPQTDKALTELTETIKEFQTVIQNKKNALFQQRQSYKYNMAEKTKQIENLKETIASTLNKVTTVANKIDMVLKENGSSNNNN